MENINRPCDGNGPGTTAATHRCTRQLHSGSSWWRTSSRAAPRARRWGSRRATTRLTSRPFLARWTRRGCSGCSRRCGLDGG